MTTSNEHRAGLQKQIPCFVYILLLSNGRFYTGMTIDLQKRLKEHNKGRSKSTCKNLPVKLIYYTIMKSQREARWLEKKIKNRGAAKYLRIRQSKKQMREIEVFAEQREKELAELNKISPYIELF